MLDYGGFIRTVAERAHASPEDADRAARATLRTLAERLTAGETEDIVERLPAELRACLDGVDGFEPFHADEFLRRVAARANVDSSHAERAARAVFVALWHALGPDEFDDLRSELPKDFESLLGDALGEPAPPPPAGTVATVSGDDFVARVAERARLGRERARRAAEAVLEALAYRITAGQVEDLERRLPADLQPALERGKSQRRPARPLSLDTFLALIADREGVDRGQAAEHARAVIDVLREVAGEDEFHDTTRQLPGEYRVLLRRG